MTNCYAKTVCTPRAPAVPAGPRVSRLAERMIRVFETWRVRARERRELHAMSDRDLADIGVRRLDAEREAAKPFWRP